MQMSSSRRSVTAGDAAGVAAVLDPAVELRSDHVLDREPGVDEVVVARGVHRLEMAQQRMALIPRHVLAPVDDVVTGECAHREERDVPESDLRRELLELGADLLEAGFGVADEVHLVHTDHEVRDPEQGGEKRMPAGLFDHPGTGVDQDDREVDVRRAGDHVPGVLHVPRAVRDDEGTSRGREVPPRHVDGDALFALGAQTIGEQ